jgi:broad specificity phosphatase PhoE
MDPEHPGSGVEPVAHVLDRSTALIQSLEGAHQDMRILLVSHGDTLGILGSAFAGTDPGNHHALWQLGLGECRPLNP